MILQDECQAIAKKYFATEQKGESQLAALFEELTKKEEEIALHSTRYSKYWMKELGCVKTLKALEQTELNPSLTSSDYATIEDQFSISLGKVEAKYPGEALA